MGEYGRKRIAILCGQPDEDFQSQFIEGFEKQAFGYGFDVCVFAMYQKFQESKGREIGESTIFSLINGEVFDAFLVMGDTIQTPGVLERIDERLHETATGPVLFVDSDSKYFSSVKLHHYDAIVKCIEHLIDEHGFKDIAFLTGKIWHPHSKERLNAFLDTMKRHGLPVGDDRVFYGDFWYTSGVNVAESFIREKKTFPEAFACANDYMAIGLAEALTRNGIKVPEDVAVIAYDSVEEGRTSPCPITSVYLPVAQFGSYLASSLSRLMNGEDLEAFSPDYEMFLGGSCGCRCESVVPRVILRKGWKTDLFAKNFYSADNRLLEDMYAKEDLRSVLEVVKSYMYQLSDYESIHICLDSEWAEGYVGDKREGYTDTMYEVFSYSSKDGNSLISFDRPFDIRDILPLLNEESKFPRAFQFTPVHFDSNCFGYAAVSFGNRPKVMDMTYTFWLRYVMLGIEALRRQTELANTRHTIEEIRHVDNLTGLYNYDGIVECSAKLIEPSSEGAPISVVAVDITGVGAINDELGRKGGDRVICEFSRLLKTCSGEKSLCGRLGNDEFIVILDASENSDLREDELILALMDRLSDYNEGQERNLSFASGYVTGTVRTEDDIEDLINAAVSDKNGNKMRSRKIRLSGNFTEEESKTADKVAYILDNNQLDYHFQPIVSTYDGRIYAYEALMRPVSDPYIAPPVMIEYANRLGRIEEVEKLTFQNVLKIVEENKEAFEGKKVFINSIPGIIVNGADRALVMDKLTALSDRVVIELTEHSELDDETLELMKEEYRRMGIQRAVDDYGTGYSNIVNLLRYMPDYVKIDRMLLSGIEDNPQKQHFVSDIVKFAHENDFKVLSEGVETSAELETCIRLGTDLIQGFYTARPSKEIIPELPAEVREEIFRYSARYFGDTLGSDI